VALGETVADQQKHAATEAAGATATLTLRVVEACIEDIGHATAGLSQADLTHIGARIGDVLKISAATVAVARAELTSDENSGYIQIDGTTRSNCGVGLQEQVTVSRVEYEQAVAVRLTPLWLGAAPATISPDRWCKRAALRAIVEFQEGVRREPFLVSCSDFLNVLEPVRGDAEQPASAPAANNFGNHASMQRRITFGGRS
jgi:hypothetical protein